MIKSPAMCPAPTIIQLAIPSPLNTCFDYLAPEGVQTHHLKPGMRVRVPFGHGTKIGIILTLSNHSQIKPHRLKHIEAVIDEQPIISSEILALLKWAWRYYHHAPGEVTFSALPTWLRGDRPAVMTTTTRWRINEQHHDEDLEALQRAPRQKALFECLKAHPGGLTAIQLNQLQDNWRASLKALIKRGWLCEEQCPLPAIKVECEPDQAPPLNPAQTDAINTIKTGFKQGFAPYLLEGVTGSGKTEVYLALVESAIQADAQALILVPEIGLTPQLIQRFQARFGVPLAVIHSGLSEKERFHAWMMARDGTAPIVIGTRSAIFTPLKQLGLIIIDEEHDASFKQTEGFRYHARDVALIRARTSKIPIVLGSATPAFESLHNALQGRYHHLELPERVTKRRSPKIQCLDIQRLPVQENISRPLRDAMRAHLAQGQQVLLFLNRRGYAPTMICQDCGEIAMCKRCDAHMIYHQAKGLLRCHHCDAVSRANSPCPNCNSPNFRPIGYGTERVEETLQATFPDSEVIRIDRDSTRLKGALNEIITRIRDGHNQILLGTQMLAKGHHLPNVTMVGILDADHGLFGIDFRASERMGQLIVQVAGRAGRAEKPGEVFIQTRHPDHPLLNALLTHDYNAFARDILKERELIGWPPYAHLALLRASAMDQGSPMNFLKSANQAAQTLNASSVDRLGPAPAPMERRGGRYHAHLLFKSTQRAPLHQLLAQLRPQLERLPLARKVRWSLDIDPVDLF